MTFNARSKKHDEIAIPFTIKQLKRYGYTKIVTQGHEYDKAELRQLLAKQRSKIALLKRFKPDIIAMKNSELVFCEVKSEQNGYNNYSVEFDSFIALKEHSRNGPAIYSFINIDPASEIVLDSRICDVQEMNYPFKIFVPKRFDYRSTENYIKKNHPSVSIRFMEHRGGSGTAYFLISKNDILLESWPNFHSIEVSQPSLF